MKKFVHRFIPGSDPGRTLLLLHGTGGDENDLLPLGRAIDPGAALLSPRGRVLENGSPRFFRRLAEGVFDEQDVVARAQELADFVDRAIKTYSIDEDGLVAVGYSNGANIASAMLLLGAAKFRGAVLFRPMVPLSNSPFHPLAESRVLLCGGEYDPIATVDQVNALAHLLRQRGAEVDMQMGQSGHELIQADIASAREWLATTPIA